MPSGLKNKMVLLHATTTTKVRNRPHQKTITYPHAAPEDAAERHRASGWGRGSNNPSTPPWQARKDTG